MLLLSCCSFTLKVVQALFFLACSGPVMATVAAGTEDGELWGVERLLLVFCSCGLGGVFGNLHHCCGDADGEKDEELHVC